MNSGGQPTASNATRLLPPKVHNLAEMLCYDITGKSEKEIKAEGLTDNSDFP